MHVASAQNLLKTISTVALATGFALCFGFLISALCPQSYFVAGFTLVTLKVRMND
jgi:hypothetical protein